MKMHPSITLDRIMEAVEREMFGMDNPGFCVACGEKHDGAEPDATRITCEYCGEKAIHGAEQLLLMTVG